MKSKTFFSMTSSLALALLLLGNACKKDKSATILVDVDGNSYKTVTIGTQTWMAENLKTTKYSDGTAVTEVTDAAAWFGLQTGAMCWYNNDIANKNTLGALYNWYAVNNPAGLAPKGWHVATKADWQTLEDYLIANGYNYDGTKSGNKIGKSVASKTGWALDNTKGNIGNDPASNNKSGLNLTASGLRASGLFASINTDGFYWTATEADLPKSYFSNLFYDSFPLQVFGFFSKVYGMSVRCVKD